jgi:hypothetical protein
MILGIGEQWSRKYVYRVQFAEHTVYFLTLAVVQLLFATGKSFPVDGLREKLREFFLQEGSPGAARR